MEILRKRNAGTTVYFPMIKASVLDFATASDWTPISTDIQHSVDGGAFSILNTNIPTHEGRGIWSIPLIASELSGKVTVLAIVDDATKEVEDQAIIIQTYGDDSAGLSFNVIADHVIRRTFQNACDSSDGDTKTGRSLLGAIAKLVNKVASSVGTLTIYEDDDTTSLFTQTVTTDSGADPITTLDTD
jgi:hypothetical protein